MTYIGFASFKAASLCSFETSCFSGPAELATICTTFSDCQHIWCKFDLVRDTTFDIVRDTTFDLVRDITFDLVRDTTFDLMRADTTA